MAFKVVMTGKSGFIGSHLAALLSRSGYTVCGLVRQKASDNDLVCSLTDPVELTGVLAELQPDYFLHLASLAQPGRDWGTLPDQYVNTVAPAVHIANALPECVRLSIFFGSCEEYGNSPPPFSEDRPLQCFSPYGWGKISSYYAVSALMRQRRLAFSWVRPFLTFGPGQKPNNLVPWLIEGCLRGQKMPLTPGEQTRDLIYVEDVCKMVFTLLQNQGAARDQTFNLCSGVPRRIRDVAELIAGLAGGGSLDFGALPYRSDEAMSFYGSPAKFIERFGSPGMFPFEEAMALTVDSYKRGDLFAKTS